MRPRARVAAVPLLGAGLLAASPAWPAERAAAPAADPAAVPLMVEAPPIRLALARQAFRLKAPPMVLPDGRKPGSVSRIIRPFGPWTLICDDDAEARRRVCMTSQTIEDEAGRLAFSWSLAASADRRPTFILRAPVSPQGAQVAVVAVGPKPADQRRIALDACDGEICLGYLPLDGAIARAVRTGSAVEITTATMPTVRTTFAELGAAVAAIR